MKHAFLLTDRDREIIRRVHAHRLLKSRSHILPLFGGSTNLLRRLQKLTEHRYLYRLPNRRPHEEAIYALGNEGATLLQKEFGIERPSVDFTAQNKKLSGRFIRHTLLVADITLRIELACRAHPDARFIDRDEIIEQWAPEHTRRKSRKVGKDPLRWRVEIRYNGWRGTKGITPDQFFGIDLLGRDPLLFFLEADRASMPVTSSNLHRSSILKKLLIYYQGWQAGLYAKHFGTDDIRTLFVLETGYRGQTRIEECLAAAEEVAGDDKGKGTGLFLFVKKEDLLEAPDVLHAPLISGRGAEKTLVG